MFGSEASERAVPVGLFDSVMLVEVGVFRGSFRCCFSVRASLARFETDVEAGPPGQGSDDDGGGDEEATEGTWADFCHSLFSSPKNMRRVGDRWLGNSTGKEEPLGVGDSLVMSCNMEETR